MGVDAGGHGEAAGSPGAPKAAEELGRRLASEERRLRLLLTHLAGPAVRRRVEVDDLLQETWLRALARPERLPDATESEGGALGRYLARIARHVVVDVARALRAAKRDGACVRLERSDWSRAPGGVSRLAAPGPGPATRAAGGEGADGLVAAFAALSAEHRRVLGLRQLEGLSAREAARRMGRSETAVHSLYRRALEAWRARCDDFRGEGGESRGARRPELP